MAITPTCKCKKTFSITPKVPSTQITEVKTTLCNTFTTHSNLQTMKLWIILWITQLEPIKPTLKMTTMILQTNKTSKETKLLSQGRDPDRIRTRLKMSPIKSHLKSLQVTRVLSPGKQTSLNLFSPGISLSNRWPSSLGMSGKISIEFWHLMMNKTQGLFH